jgi:hypothetical protein
MDLGIIALVVVVVWCGVFVLALAMCKTSARADAAQEAPDRPVRPAHAPAPSSPRGFQLYQG